MKLFSYLRFFDVTRRKLKIIRNNPMYNVWQLKNSYFTMKILPQHHLYVNNTYNKFQGQKIYQKKDIRNLLTCVVVKCFSLLLTLTASQRLIIFFLPWNFWNDIISMLIICVPNFKYKRFTQEKILEIYQHVLLWGKFSLLPTLTPSQGLKNCFIAIKFLAWVHLYVDNMCDKFQGQKIHLKKYIRNLLTCIVGRKIF